MSKNVNAVPRLFKRLSAQGDNNGQGLSFVDFTSIVVSTSMTTLPLFHCLPNFAWAAENRAEMAEQLSKLDELEK